MTAAVNPFTHGEGHCTPLPPLFFAFYSKYLEATHWTDISKYSEMGHPQQKSLQDILSKGQKKGERGVQRPSIWAKSLNRFFFLDNLQKFIRLQNYRVKFFATYTKDFNQKCNALIDSCSLVSIMVT